MSFGDGLPVWGGNTATCVALIDHAIIGLGSRGYLLELKRSFDYGYNHADLSNLGPAELAEFRDVCLVWFRTQLDGHVGASGLSELHDSFVALSNARIDQLGRS